MMTIRPAKSSDATVIAKIHIDSWRAAYKGIVPDSRLDKFNYIQHTERFRQSLETHSEETYVAEIDMQIIGFLTIGPCRDDDLDQNVTGEIWGIYLNPNYWRKGIGRSLCEWAENTLSTRGYEQIILWVFADNIQSRKFYETIGYLHDGASKVLNIGKPIRAVRYLKTLQTQLSDSNFRINEKIISIKPSTTENHDFIRKAHHLAYLEMVQRQFGKWNQSQQDEFVSRDLLEDDHEIIFFGNEPCGYFSISLIQGKLHLVNFAILPEYQSKGIGGLVIEKLKERSKKSDKPISIGTFKTNLYAQRFYEKHDLKRCGEAYMHFIYEWPDKS